VRLRTIFERGKKEMFLRELAVSYILFLSLSLFLPLFPLLLLLRTRWRGHERDVSSKRENDQIADQIITRRRKFEGKKKMSDSFSSSRPYVDRMMPRSHHMFCLLFSSDLCLLVKNAPIETDSYGTLEINTNCLQMEKEKITDGKQQHARDSRSSDI
jgi:hypothetical protein